MVRWNRVSQWSDGRWEGTEVVYEVVQGAKNTAQSTVVMY